MEILVIIATYNERENIQTLIPKVLALPYDIEVLIIDDSSPDGTGELAEKLGAETGRVHVIHRPGKLGLGTALKEGLKFGVESKANLIATMDADHSHAPEYLPALIEKAKKAAVVVGSRYVPGGGVRNWGVGRKILSRTANTYARMITGLRIKDCTTGYRVYRREFLAGLDLDAIASRGYSFLVEILVHAKRAGYTVEETPIIFIDRIKGQSKIDHAEVVYGAWSLFKVRFKRVGR